jgi:hypothetical protein
MSLVIVDPSQGLTNEKWDNLEHIWRADTFEKFLSYIKFHNNFIEQKRPFVFAIFASFEIYGELKNSCKNVFKDEFEILPIIWQNTGKQLGKNKHLFRNVTRLLAMIYIGGRSQNVTNETPECTTNVICAVGERNFAANNNVYEIASLPVALIENLIRAHSNPSDWIFCACSGTGSTMIAALHEERNCISMEKDTFNFQGLQIRFITEIKSISQESTRKAIKRSIDVAENSQAQKKSKPNCITEMSEDKVDDDSIGQPCCYNDCDEQNDLSRCDKCQKLFCKVDNLVISGDNQVCFQCMNL